MAKPEIVARVKDGPMKGEDWVMALDRREGDDVRLTSAIGDEYTYRLLREADAWVLTLIGSALIRRKLRGGPPCA